MREYDKDETLAFLTEQAPPWSDMLSDVLKQNGIPHFMSPALGAGMTLKVGSMLERFSFYVPYSFIAEARALVEELFSGSAGEEPEE